MANTHSIDLEDGSSQSLSISDAAQTGLDITGDISIEAWIKRESSTGNDIVVAKFLSAGDQRSYQVNINDSGQIQALYSSDGGFTASSNITWFITDSGEITSLDTWYHIAVTMDVSAKDIKFYVNAVEVNASIAGADWNHATSIFDSSAEVSIGADEAHASNLFDGLIDEVRIWNDIRTSTEIEDNYQKELVGNEAGLQAYWKLNNSLLDETSNNNDLTNNNSATFSTDIPLWTIIFDVLDTFTITDSETAIRTRLFTLSDTFTITEAISTLRGIPFIVSDSIGLTDTVTALRARITNISDNIGLTDTLGRFTTIRFNVSDTFSLSDLLGRFTTIKFTVSDTFSLTDLLGRFTTIRFSVTDTLNLTDTATAILLWRKLVKHTSSWINKAKNSSIWTPKDRS